MATTKAAFSAIIPRGTSNAAFAQLSTTAVTTRSGTTATATVTNTTLAVNDYVLMQGHDLEEYNGVFQVASLISTTGITYVIKQDPGASSGTTVMTVDKVTFGTAIDMSTDYGGEVNGGLQNGNSAPGVAPQIWMGSSSTSTLADYVWRQVAGGDTSAKSLTSFSMQLPQSKMFVNFIVCRNTTNAIDCFLLASHITAV